MILKFDHITYVAPRSEKNTVLREKQILFAEENLLNMPIKRRLMDVWQKDHDLFYDRSNELPVEYLFYDQVSCETGIIVDGNSIISTYQDHDKAVQVLKALFGQKVKEDDNIIKCNLKGILDRRDYWLRLEKSEEPRQRSIDQRGFGTIALVIGEDDEIQLDNSIKTETGSLSVNGKMLNIFFVKEESLGIVFELIKVGAL